MKRCIILVSLLASSAVADPTHACTIIAVGKDASVDGSVIVSHSDAGPDSRIRVVRGRTHSPGEMAPVYWGIQDATLALEDDGEVLGEIPQAAETYTYFHSAYSHLNAHQLAIAESTTTQRPELAVEKGKGEQIMTIEQAQIFALQRCTQSDRGGGAHRQPDGDSTAFCPPPATAPRRWPSRIRTRRGSSRCSASVPAGTRASGKPGAIWAAQRLADDHACMIPNWSIIKEIDPDDRERFLVSSNYLQEAVDRGWYDPASGRPFVWQEAYAPLPQEYRHQPLLAFPHHFTPRACGTGPTAAWRGDPYAGLNQYYQLVEPLSIYPFSVQPDEKISRRGRHRLPALHVRGHHLRPDLGTPVAGAGRQGRLVKSPLATPFPGRDLRALLKLTYRRPVARHRGHYGMVTAAAQLAPRRHRRRLLGLPGQPVHQPLRAHLRRCPGDRRGLSGLRPESYSERSARWVIDFVDNLANLGSRRPSRT